MEYQVVGDYINDARTLLLDRLTPYRYDTVTLVTALNATLLEVRRIRPDVLADYLDNIPQYTWNNAESGLVAPLALDFTNSTDQSDNQVNDADDDDNPAWQMDVPIDPQFRTAIVHGMVAHALSRDQEDIEDERATGFMKTFVNMMTGVDATAGKAPPKV